MTDGDAGTAVSWGALATFAGSIGLAGFAFVWLLYGLSSEFREAPADIARGAAGRILPTIGAGVVVGVLVTLGLVLFVIPGILIAARLQWAYVLALRGGMRPMDAVWKCWSLTHGRTLELLWLQIRLSLLFAGVYAIVLGTVLVGMIAVGFDPTADTPRSAIQSGALAVVFQLVVVLAYALHHCVGDAYLSSLESPVAWGGFVSTEPRREPSTDAGTISFALGLDLVLLVAIHAVGVLLGQAGGNALDPSEIGWANVVSDFLLWVFIPTLVVLAASFALYEHAAPRTRGRTVLLTLLLLLPVQWLHYGAPVPTASASLTPAEEKRGLIEQIVSVCPRDCRESPGLQIDCAAYCRCVRRDLERLSLERLRNLVENWADRRTVELMQRFTRRCRRR